MNIVLRITPPPFFFIYLYIVKFNKKINPITIEHATIGENDFT